MFHAPESPPGSPGSRLFPGQHGIVRIFPEVPGQTGFHEFQSHVFVAGVNAGDHASVYVEIEHLYLDDFPENQLGCELLGAVGEILSALRTVNAFQANLESPVFPHHADCVPVRHADTFSGKGAGPGADHRRQEEQEENGPAQ